jgi:hypothetical protein
VQHFNPAAFRTVSPADRKAVALSAYDTACAMPAGADWRMVADLLRAALPGSKATAGDGAPAWWADYKLPKHYRLDSLLVRFADDVAVRVNVAIAKGKPARIASACRAAIGFYRARTGNLAVPAFAWIENVSTGGEFDAAECSRLTADLRTADAGRVEKAGPRAVTADNLARMEAEVERRRAGLARHLADGTAPTSAEASEWRAAVAAGENELALMRTAFLPSDPEPDSGVSAFASSEEVGKTDTNAGTITFAATIVSPEVNEATAATGSEIPADLTTGNASEDHAKVSGPAVMHTKGACKSLETHPIIAVCTSHRAREKLFRAIQDGCVPAFDHRSKGGAYRITLLDAQEIGAIKGVRFVGMPRKPRSRPVAAVVSFPAPIAPPSLAAPLSLAA